MSSTAPRVGSVLPTVVEPGIHSGTTRPLASVSGRPPALAKSVLNKYPVDDCELPPRRISENVSKPALTSWEPQPEGEAKYDTLPVSWLLSRSSGSVRSKYAGPKCSPPGDTRPMVRNGESCSRVLVLPKRGWFALREYCAVAKKRFANTPFQLVANMWPGVSVWSPAVGSMVMGSDGAKRCCRRSRYCTWTVWFVSGVAVTFTSQRC